MAEVLRHVNEGLFFPDAPAGERWKSGNAPTCSSSSSASSESSREESEVEELSDAESIDGTGFGNNLLARSLGKDCKERDARLFCYMKTGRIHCGLSSSLTHTFCNTLITSCEPMASGLDFDADEQENLCKNCFGRDESKARKLKRSLTSLPDDEELFELVPS